jgi:hypothetical protein
VRKALLILCLTVLVSCTKREDFPPTLPIAAPPVPENLQIKKINTLIGVLDEYELNWDVSDPSVVEFFRLYAVSGFLLEHIGDTSAPPETVTTLSMTGLVFGVTTVSVQNVESDPTFALAPDTLATSSR